MAELASLSRAPQELTTGSPAAAHSTSAALGPALQVLDPQDGSWQESPPPLNPSSIPAPTQTSAFPLTKPASP